MPRVGTAPKTRPAASHQQAPRRATASASPTCGTSCSATAAPPTAPSSAGRTPLCSRRASTRATCAASGSPSWSAGRELQPWAARRREVRPICSALTHVRAGVGGQVRLHLANTTPRYLQPLCSWLKVPAALFVGGVPPASLDHLVAGARRSLDVRRGTGNIGISGSVVMTSEEGGVIGGGGSTTRLIKGLYRYVINTL